MGGQNSDDDPRLINDEDFLNLQDGRIAISANGRNLRVENLRGTTDIAVVNSLLPITGNNFTIGTAVDRARGWVIIFNANDLGEDGIYAYDKANNIGYIVLLNSNLNPERVSCIATFFGGGSNFGTSAQFVYSGTPLVGDLIRANFVIFGGSDSVNVFVTAAFGETLIDVLARLVIAFNSNATAIANSLTAILIGTTIFFDFNGVLWGGASIIALVTNVNKPLNFSKANRVNRNAKVIGDLLYWTDNFNQPQKINYIAGIKTNQPSFVTTVLPYQIPIDYKVITWIKRPPIYPILFEKQYDAAYANNLIQDNTFFCTYQYEYRDYEQSAFATFSKLIPFNRYLPPTYAFPNIDENYNRIFLNIPYQEKIPQDVNKINIYIKYGVNGNGALVKVFDRDITADALLIEQHNNSTSPTNYLSVFFYNDVKGIGIDSFLEIDNVPLLIKSIEVARNRLFSGNDLFGYNTPLKSSLTFSNVSITPVLSTMVIAFNNASRRNISIAFYDEFKRKCGSFFVGTNTSSNYPSWQAVPTVNSEIDWTLSNTNAGDEIPDWAYYYSIDVSKDLNQSYFISGLSHNVQYAKLNPNGTYTYQNTYNSLEVYALAIYIGDLSIQTRGYAFNEGDFARVSLPNNVNIPTLKVLAVDGNNLLVTPFDFGTFPLAPDNPMVFFIYTPRTQDVDEPFYEQGGIFNVVDPTTSGRTYETLSGAIMGDIYVYINPALNSGKYAKYENMSPNFRVYLKWETNSGFINIVDKIGQKALRTTISFTDTYLNGTQSNGLNKFGVLNRKDIGSSSSQIQNLILTNKKEEDGTVMLIITENEILSAYLGEVQLVGASKNADVAVVNEIIGTINALKLNSGTLNPESVFEYMGLVFWFDTKNGYVSQYSSNGVSPISDFKLNRYFKRYAEDYRNTNPSVIEAINGFSHIPMCMDPYHREVMVTMPALIFENYAQVLPSYSSVPPYATSILNRFDIYDKLAKTMAFDFEENKWRCNYSFMPEWMDEVDNQLYLFKNGLMYSHSTNASAYNTYFGVQYPLRLCSSWNIKEAPSAIKDVFDIAIEGNVAPDFSVLYSEYPWIQISDLTVDNYRELEGVFYASWFRDRLSVNTGTPNPDENLYKGNIVKSAYPFAMFEFQQYANLMYINFIQIGFAISRGTQIILNK